MSLLNWSSLLGDKRAVASVFKVLDYAQGGLGPKNVLRMMNQKEENQHEIAH